MGTDAHTMKVPGTDRRWRIRLQPGELLPENTFFIAVW